MAMLFWMEAAYAPMSQDWNHGMEDTMPYIIENEEFVTTLGARVLLLNDLLFVEGEIETRSVVMDMGNVYPSGWPIRDTYMIGAGVKLGGFTIGWEHVCSHPIATMWGYEGDLKPDYSVREAAWDRLYVRFEGRADLITSN
jgi:hypothetical protein